MSVLFEEMEIGSLRAKNRLVRAATYEALADDGGHMTPELTAIYEELADGGVGTIIVGYARVMRNEQPNPRMLGIYDDSFVPEFRALTDMAHAHGTAIVSQIVYGGSATKLQPPSRRILGPSAVANPKTGIVPVEATVADLHELAQAFADAIVVLGASVFADGTPSGILRDRLDDGIALYKEGVAPKLIMSGDNSTVSYNDVQVMKDYAISQGVPSYDIFCDHAGFSTYESMYRAKHVFGAERIVVATQTYHLYRALYAAQGLGLESLGVASDYHDYSKQLQYDLREIPARTKDFFKTLFKVPSTFVGDPISLDQSGDVTEG